MTTEKKDNMKNWVSTWLTPSLILGSLLYGSWFVSGYMSDSKQRMFESVEQRIKTKTLVDTPYSEYQNLKKRDSLLSQQKELFVIFDTINKMYESDIEDKEDRIKSRAQRDSILIETSIAQIKSDSVQKEIQREQKILANTNQLILDALIDIKAKQNEEIEQ